MKCKACGHPAPKRFYHGQAYFEPKGFCPACYIGKMETEHAQLIEELRAMIRHCERDNFFGYTGQAKAFLESIGK